LLSEELDKKGAKKWKLHAWRHYDAEKAKEEEEEEEEEEAPEEAD
jgi:hypothetical protein